MSVINFNYFNKINKLLMKKAITNPAKTKKLGIAVSLFMKENGIKVDDFRRECKIGSTRLSFFKKES